MLEYLPKFQVLILEIGHYIIRGNSDHKFCTKILYQWKTWKACIFTICLPCMKTVIWCNIVNIVRKISISWRSLLALHVHLGKGVKNGNNSNHLPIFFYQKTVVFGPNHCFKPFAISGLPEYCCIFHFLFVLSFVRPSQAWHLNEYISSRLIIMTILTTWTTWTKWTTLTTGPI